MFAVLLNIVASECSYSWGSSRGLLLETYFDSDGHGGSEFASIYGSYVAYDSTVHTFSFESKTYSSSKWYAGSFTCGISSWSSSGKEKSPQSHAILTQAFRTYPFNIRTSDNYYYVKLWVKDNTVVIPNDKVIPEMDDKCINGNSVDYMCMPDPTPTPKPTPSMSPRPTPSRSPRPTSSRSPVPTPSMSPLPTHSFSMSVQFSKTLIFDPSNNFSQTFEFNETEQLSKSEDFLMSNNFSESYQFNSTDFLNESSVFSQSINLKESFEFSKSVDFSKSMTNDYIIDDNQETSIQEYDAITSSILNDLNTRRNVDLGQKNSYHQKTFIEEQKFNIKRDGNKKSTGLIVGISVGIIAIIIIIAIFFLIKRRKVSSTQQSSMDMTTETYSEESANFQTNIFITPTCDNPLMYGETCFGNSEQIIEMSIFREEEVSD